MSVLTYYFELHVRKATGNKDILLLIFGMVVVLILGYILEAANQKSPINDALRGNSNVQHRNEIKAKLLSGDELGNIKIKELVPPAIEIPNYQALVSLTISETSFGEESLDQRFDLKGDMGSDQFFEFITQNYHQCENLKILESSETHKDLKRCYQSKKGRPVDIVLIGDSHAEHLFIGLAQAMPQKNIAYYIRGDLPFLENSKFTEIFTEIKRDVNIKTIVLSALWSRRIGSLKETHNIKDEFNSLFAWLKDSGKKVYITDNVPIFPFEPDHCAKNRKLSPMARNCEIDKADADKKSIRFRSALEEALLMNPEVNYFSVEKYLCSSLICSMRYKNFLLYRDNRHLNIYGSVYVGQRILHDNSFLGN
jgi:hypothetical protein